MVKVYLKNLSGKELDSICENNCDKCILRMNNPIYHTKECAINPLTGKIRDEYLNHFIKLKKY